MLQQQLFKGAKSCVPVVLLLQIEMLPQIQILQNPFCHLRMFCYQHIHMTGLPHSYYYLLCKSYRRNIEENNTFFVMVFLFGLAFLCLKPKSQAQSSTMFCDVSDELFLLFNYLPRRKSCHLFYTLLGEAEFGLIVVASTLLEVLTTAFLPSLCPVPYPSGGCWCLLLQACTDVFVGCYGVRKYDV